MHHGHLGFGLFSDALAGPVLDTIAFADSGNLRQNSCLHLFFLLHPTNEGTAPQAAAGETAEFSVCVHNTPVHPMSAGVWQRCPLERVALRGPLI